MSTDFESRAVRLLLVEDDEDDYVLTRDLLGETRMPFTLDWVSTYDDAMRAAAGAHTPAMRRQPGVVSIEPTYLKEAAMHR